VLGHVVIDDDTGACSDSSVATTTNRGPTRALHERGKRALAKTLRHNPTTAEAEAWGGLRGRQVVGLKFRRQQIVCGFVVDFFCADARLIVELDGGIHEEPEQHEHDARRTAALSAAGFTIIRIPNDDVVATLAQRIRESQGRCA